jgi:hypothetical protein
VSEKLRATESLDRRSDELADDQIQRLLHDADRLAFGVCPPGFVLAHSQSARQ